MRQPFAHEAVVEVEGEGDLGAPGAAITVALCGHWEHEPPCPLAPHHTAAERVADEIHLRTLFVVEPAREHEVRQRIRAGLGTGQVAGPDGGLSQWRLRSDRPSPVHEEEADHARRLAAS